MDNCVVCLEANKDIHSRITTLSSEWVECKMRRVIEKHLWWWYLEPSSQKSETVRWICRQCWNEISAFHRFYVKAERAHRNFHKIVKEKNRLEVSNSLESSNNDYILAKERSKERHHKELVNIDRIEEMETQITDVKGEFSISSNEYCINEGADMFVDISYKQKFEDNDDTSNDAPTDEDDTLIYKSNIIKFENKAKHKVARSKQNLPKKTNTKITNLKKNPNCERDVFDNFFKENEHELECFICKVPLPDFRSIKAHYRNEHNTRGYAMCCGKKYFKRCLLVDHLKVHSDPNFFKCQLCEKSFATRRGLEMHLDIHKTRERKFSCDECGKSYFKLHVFERHKLTHVPESEKHFDCSQCNKKFASDYLRRQHEDSTHEKKYAKICDVCGRSFCHNYSFLRHMEEHAGTPKSMETCDICGVKLTNKYGLKQHKKMRHLEENLQEQICPYCSRVSPNQNAHRMHIKYTHTMQRKHCCHLCDKAFRRPLELKEHLCTHTGETLYTCPHCPRSFVSNANMHKHRKIAHRKEWEESRLKKLNESGGKTISADAVSKSPGIQKIPEDLNDLIAESATNSESQF